jgi:hypothetical protein
MVKMKLLNLYKCEDVPDYVIEEMGVHIKKICDALQPIISDANSNLNLSAMNHVMAMMVQLYISDKPEEIKRAAVMLAKGFLGNVKFYTGVDVMEVEDG